MRFLFAPGMAVLRPMPNQVKLPFIVVLYLLPTVLALLLQRTLGELVGGARSRRVISSPPTTSACSSCGT